MSNYKYSNSRAFSRGLDVIDGGVTLVGSGLDETDDDDVNREGACGRLYPSPSIFLALR